MGVGNGFEDLAPQVGFEPTTLRLTAECSTVELLRNRRAGLQLLDHSRYRPVKLQKVGLQNRIVRIQHRL